MAELHYISRRAGRGAERAPLEVHRGNYYSAAPRRFFFEYVRQQLIERYGAQDRRAGRAEGVHDDRPEHAAPRAQGDRRSARRARRPRLGDRHDRPANGDIEAMAESESYEQSQYNLAADGHRQPGSTFKAIDLADALSHGIDPNTTYYLSHTLEPGWLPTYPNYEVKTFEGTSLNKPINLVRRRSPPTTPSTPSWRPTSARKRSPKWPTRWASRRTCSSYPAEALGGLTLGVTPLEMADVYATLADGGWRNTPIAITKVVFPDGRVDSNWGVPHRVKVLSEARHRRGDEDPPRERRERHRDALGDQLPDRRQDGHDQQNCRRLARRLHAPTTRRSCGWAIRTSASR